MPLSDAFKNAMESRTPDIKNDNLVCFRTNTPGGSIYHAYDFALQVVTISCGHGLSVTQFRDYQRGMLENLRDYMIDQGLNPLPLPEIEQKTGLGFEKDFGGGMK